MNRSARAAVIHEFGPPEILTLSDYSLPSLAPNQVLIRLKAFGIHPLELRLRAGQFRPNLFPRPFVPGLDGSGIVEELGENVTKFKKGDRVYVFQPITGTYSNFCIAQEDKTYRLHPNISYEEGAALGDSYLTAHRALLHGGFKRGDSVLVQWAQGPTALAAIQLAKGLGASRIISTTRTEEGISSALQHGADAAINYTEEEFKAQLKKEVGEKGVNIIIDGDADVNFDLDMDLVARGGRIMIIGKRGSCQCDMGKAVGKEARIAGCALFPASIEDRQRSASDLYKYAEQGWLKPFIGKIYNFDEIPQCHVEIAENVEAVGKRIVLVED